MSNELERLADADVELFIDEWCNGGKHAAFAIRDYYEGLIISGKLRLVVEVEAMCGDHGGIEGRSCSECSAPVMPEAWMFCPGCGNKVKWPK